MKEKIHLCIPNAAIRRHWEKALEAHHALVPCPDGSPPANGLVVLEAQAGDTELADLAETLDAMAPVATVMVISPVPQAAQGLAAIRHGARGYLHALANPARIRQAMEVLAGGQAWLSQEVIAAMSRQLARTIPSDGWKKELTRREIQIIEQLLEGHGNKEIAKKLHISENTVKTYLKHLFDKFNVKDRLALVLKIQKLARGET